MPKIIKNSGASEMRFNSGASLNFASGAQKQLHETATTGATIYEVFRMGNNKLWYMAGSGASPVFSASPGDLLWLANSASTSMWLNLSNGTTGSRWAALNVAVSGSQVPGVL